MQHRNARKRLGIAAACVFATLALASAAGGVGRYRDATGDSGAAPDITGATVLNAQGQITVTLAIANLQRPSQEQVQLFIDSDANPDTGNADYGGADYVLLDHEWDKTYSFGHWT